MSQPYNSNPEHPWQPVESIPLAQAVLCADCEMITKAINGHCPVCESTAIVALAKLLSAENRNSKIETRLAEAQR